MTERPPKASSRIKATDPAAEPAVTPEQTATNPADDADDIGYFGPAAMVFDLEPGEAGAPPAAVSPASPTPPAPPPPQIVTGSIAAPAPTAPEPVQSAPDADPEPTPEPLPPPAALPSTAAGVAPDFDGGIDLSAALAAQQQAWAEFVALSSDGADVVPKRRPKPSKKPREAKAKPPLDPSPPSAPEPETGFDRYVMTFDEEPPAQSTAGQAAPVSSNANGRQAKAAKPSKLARAKAKLARPRKPRIPSPVEAASETGFDRYVMTFDEDVPASTDDLNDPALVAGARTGADALVVDAGKRSAPLFQRLATAPLLPVAALLTAAAAAVVIVFAPADQPASSSSPLPEPPAFEVLLPLDQHALIGFAPDGRAMLGRTFSSQHGTVSLRVDLVSLKPGAERWDFLIACPSAKVIYRSGDRWRDTERTQSLGIADAVPVWQPLAAKFACFGPPIAGPWTGFEEAQVKAKYLLLEKKQAGPLLGKK